MTAPVSIAPWVGIAVVAMLLGVLMISLRTLQRLTETAPETIRKLFHIGGAAFLAWSFGAASHRGRAPMMLLALVIGAVLLLIMDVNRPQRGMIEVGVAPLERAEKNVSARNSALRRTGKVRPKAVSVGSESFLGTYMSIT